MRRKTLENLKVPLAAPREATVRGICYFTDLSGKQISSPLRPSVAAAPWTLPELTATPHQCLGTSHHHPGPQPRSCGGQLNPPPGGRVNGQASSCPSPGRTYSFFPAFFPSCTSFPGRATAKGALAALGKTSSRSNPISDGGKHFSRERHRCHHSPSLSLPPIAFPATGRSSSWRGRSQRQAAHGKYRLPQLWEHLEAWAGLVRGTTRAACPSCPSSAPPEGANSRCTQYQPGAWHPLLCQLDARALLPCSQSQELCGCRGRKAQGARRWEALGRRGGDLGGGRWALFR